MSDNKKNIIRQTQRWLEHVVIGLDFCPFAKAVFEQQSIHYQVSDAQSHECCLEDLMREVERLDKHESIATTLLIFANSLYDFDDFLDIVDLANNLLSEQGYDGIYQLASFHIDYCFADSLADDPANYTNRSPYPILHLIREQSITQALSNHPAPEAIPDTNIQRARHLGLQKMQALLNSIR